MIILTTKKEVQGFGNNSFGQIDIPPTMQKPYRIDCGYEHSGILTEKKELFLFGLNSFGQAPKEVIPNVDHFALGGYYTIIN